MRRPATCRGVTCAELTLWHSTPSQTLTCPLQTGRQKCSGQCPLCSHFCVTHICRNLGMGTTQWWVLTMIISDFKSLKHIGCVGAAEGFVPHNMTKKQYDQKAKYDQKANEEMGVGGKGNRSWRGALRGGGGLQRFFFHSFLCPGLSRKEVLLLSHPISVFHTFGIWLFLAH